MSWVITILKQRSNYRKKLIHILESRWYFGILRSNDSFPYLVLGSRWVRSSVLLLDVIAFVRNCKVSNYVLSFPVVSTAFGSTSSDW